MRKAGRGKELFSEHPGTIERWDLYLHFSYKKWIEINQGKDQPRNKEKCSDSDNN